MDTQGLKGIKNGILNGLFSGSKKKSNAASIELAKLFQASPHDAMEIYELFYDRANEAKLAHK